MSGPSTLEVDAASVSVAPDGGYYLLLHTTAGVVRFHVPLAVGCSVFRITNPRSSEFVTKQLLKRIPAEAQPAPSPVVDAYRSDRISEACAEFINDSSLGLSAAARRHRVHVSGVRERLVKTLGLARYQELSAQRGHRPKFSSMGGIAQ